jgi:F-type H+-transporting ATPase subunit delta
VSIAAKTFSIRSRRYAASLIDMAESEPKTLKAVESDIADIVSMIENSGDLRMMLKSPIIGRKDQKSAMDAIGKKAKFNTLTANFINVLIENGRLDDLDNIANAFRFELSKRRGEVNAHVQTAAALNAKQTKALQDAISKTVGADVMLETSVDPEVLGGMILTLGSQRIDDSVASKLERLRQNMSKSSNQNTNTATLKEVG